MLLLVLLMGMAKLKNLTQTFNKFYKAKIGRFIKTFDKASPNLHICLLFNGKQKIYINILY